MKRNLDGVYFRIQEPDGSYGNTCFSDLTEEQQDNMMEGRDIEWLKSMCKILAETLKQIGDEFDIISRSGGEDEI